MKHGLALLALGLFALVVQGAAGLVVPAHWVPDFGLLLAVAIALSVRSPAVGVLLAAGLGFAADLLSGTLLGQHALLRLFAYGAARFGSRRLNLRGALPQAVFVAILSVAHAGALLSLVAFFLPGDVPPLVAVHALVTHALVNAAVAPLVTAMVASLAAHLEGDDAVRSLRIEPRTLGL
jgi:rod shape-determining protein MreD